MAAKASAHLILDTTHQYSKADRSVDTDRLGILVRRTSNWISWEASVRRKARVYKLILR